MQNLFGSVEQIKQRAFTNGPAAKRIALIDALTVKDFGRGVPAELLQGSQTNGEHFGVGLSGMRERVNDLGGTFDIQSSGNGTLIAVSIPLATPVCYSTDPGMSFTP